MRTPPPTPLCYPRSVLPAPAPRNVNYATLLRSWAARGSRPIPVFIAVVVMLLIPIGALPATPGLRPPASRPPSQLWRRAALPPGLAALPRPQRWPAGEQVLPLPPCRSPHRLPPACRPVCGHLLDDCVVRLRQRHALCPRHLVLLKCGGWSVWRGRAGAGHTLALLPPLAARLTPRPSLQAGQLTSPPACSAPAPSLAAGAWFATFLRNVISSTLPAILLSVWQAVVLPIWFYTCAQARGLSSEALGGTLSAEPRMRWQAALSRRER